MTLAHYARIWLTSARYSIVRTLMFRGDFFIWALVELFWMSVNLLMSSVIYDHTNTVAGWTKYEMMLLVGTSLLIQRFLMGFFWSSIFEMGRNIRTGHFDFFLAQPGNVMFMATTRKLDPDGLMNSFVAAGVVIYSARQLGLHPGVADIALYALMVACGVVIHYSILVLCIVPTFWITSAQGLEGSYFTLNEFSRLPRQAFKGLANVAFVWFLPVVIFSNPPPSTLLPRFHLTFFACLLRITPFCFSLSLSFFTRRALPY